MAEQFYSTGQFAKLCGVKKQTLFHYDDIGLLSPIQIADNGYRQYSYRQYETFLLITCLKEAGMSLKQIKAFLALEDDKTRSARIAEVMRVLNGRIEHLVNVKRVLESTFGAMDPGASADEGKPDLEVVSKPAESFWLSRRLDTLDDRELVETISQLIKRFEPVAVCLASADVQRGEVDQQRYLLIPDSKLMDAGEAAGFGLMRFERTAGRLPRGAPAAGRRRLDALPAHKRGAFREKRTARRVLLRGVLRNRCHCGAGPFDRDGADGAETVRRPGNTPERLCRCDEAIA